MVHKRRLLVLKEVFFYIKDINYPPGYIFDIDGFDLQIEAKCQEVLYGRKVLYFVSFKYNGSNFIYDVTDNFFGIKVDMYVDHSEDANIALLADADPIFDDSETIVVKINTLDRRNFDFFKLVGFHEGY